MRHDCYRPGTARLAGLVELLWCSAGDARLEDPPAQWRSWSCGRQTQELLLTLRALVDRVGWARGCTGSSVWRVLGRRWLGRGNIYAGGEVQL